MGIHIMSVKKGKIGAVDLLQGLPDIHVAVEVDIAVGRMIKTAVEIGKFLKCQ